jgi:hypothetical protein
MGSDPRRTTDLPGHIMSPRFRRDGGPRTLCGLTNDVNPYGGLDVAYVAAVEGWKDAARPCKRCLGVALIAMGVGNDITE